MNRPQKYYHTDSTNYDFENSCDAGDGYNKEDLYDCDDTELFVGFEKWYLG